VSIVNASHCDSLTGVCCVGGRCKLHVMLQELLNCVITLMGWQARSPQFCRELFPHVVRVMRELAAFMNARPQVGSLHRSLTWADFG
jgi:hypothetical protein